MSNDSPEYLDRDGMRIAVVRNDQQFQRALQDVTVMAGKAPVDEMLRTNADAAQRKLPFGMMGMFIVVPQESPNWPVHSTFSPGQSTIEIVHAPKPFPMPTLVDYTLMPRTDRPLQLVTKSEEYRPFGPAAIFEISADSLTGRKGADPMLMLADVVASALAASMLHSGAKGGRPPAGLEALLQILGDGDNGQTTMWDKKNAQTVVKLGRGLMREYPNTMFCGVGNSPSYLIYAMEKASANDNKPVDVRYIPFSGRFLDRGRPNNGTLVYSKVDNVDFARYDHFKDAYRTRLAGMGLSPTAVVARHAEQGTRTAFIDNTQGGTSFMTFNTIMRLWARDEGVEKDFKAATPIIALADEDCRIAPMRGRVSIPSFNVDLQAKVVRIPHELRLAMNSNYSCERDRFVAEYPFEAWGRPPADVGRRNKETIAEVKTLIDAAIADTGPSPTRAIGGLLNRLRGRGTGNDPQN